MKDGNGITISQKLDMEADRRQEIPPLMREIDDGKIIKISARSRASTDFQRGKIDVGPILFLDEIEVSVFYVTFKRKTTGNLVFHIGDPKCSDNECHGHIYVPAGTRYKIKGGQPGIDIIYSLQEPQNFFFDHGTEITIPPDVEFTIGDEKQMFCQEVKVNIA